MRLDAHAARVTCAGLAATAWIAGCGSSVDPAAHLQPICEAGTFQVTPFQAAVPSLDQPGREIPAAPLLELTPSERRVEGVAYDTDRHVLGALTEARSMGTRMAEIRGEDPPEAPLLLVAADASLPTSRVLDELSRAHAAGFRRAQLLGWSRDAVTLPDPPDPAFAATMEQELAARSPAERAMHLAQTFEDEIWLCPGANEAFRAVASAPAEHKCILMAKGLEEALPSCPLTDHSRVVTLVHVMGTPWYDHLPASVEVRLDPEAPRPSAESPWSATLAGLDGAVLGLAPADAPDAE